jgi:hypothetical protein
LDVGAHRDGFRQRLRCQRDELALELPASLELFVDEPREDGARRLTGEAGKLDGLFRREATENGASLRSTAS